MVTALPICQGKGNKSPARFMEETLLTLIMSNIYWKWAEKIEEKYVLLTATLLLLLGWPLDLPLLDLGQAAETVARQPETEREIEY